MFADNTLGVTRENVLKANKHIYPNNSRHIGCYGCSGSGMVETSSNLAIQQCVTDNCPFVVNDGDLPLIISAMNG